MSVSLPTSIIWLMASGKCGAGSVRTIPTMHRRSCRSKKARSQSTAQSIRAMIRYDSRSGRPTEVAQHLEVTIDGRREIVLTHELYQGTANRLGPPLRSQILQPLVGNRE